MSIESKLSPLFNIVLQKYMDRGKYHTCDLGIYLHKKTNEDQSGLDEPNTLETKFKPISFSKTSSFILELVYLISSDSHMPSKYIHKSINLREVINLRAASNLSSQAVSVSESKITFGEISQLAMFLADKVKNEGLFEGEQKTEE